MHLRKRGNLWRVDVRYKGSRVSKSFTKKGLATMWAIKTLAQLELGTYQDTDKLFSLLISRAISVGQKELGIPIASNPVKLVTLPKEPDHRDRVITHEEYKRLLKECSRSSVYFLRNVVELAYETLCRRGEILALNLDDINFKNQTAIIHITKSGKKRRIGLSNRAIEVIKQLPRSIDGKLFHLDTVSYFEKEFKRAVTRAKIKDFTFHDLRHFGATTLAKAGWTTQELMAQGGWSSADMVKRYANINAEHLSKRLRGI